MNPGTPLLVRSVVPPTRYCRFLVDPGSCCPSNTSSSSSSSRTREIHRSQVT